MPLCTYILRTYYSNLETGGIPKFPLRDITRSAVSHINTFTDIWCMVNYGINHCTRHQVLRFYVETQLRSAATPEKLISQEVKCHKQWMNEHMNSLRPRADMGQNKLMCKGNGFAEFLSYAYKKKLTQRKKIFVFKISHAGKNWSPVSSAYFNQI